MNAPALSPEHVRILKEFAQDTGACRINKDNATALAAACSAALEIAEAYAAILNSPQKGNCQ